MGAPNSGKRSQLDTETVLLWVLIIVVVLSVGTVTGAVHLGSALAHDGQKLPANPFELVLGLFTHKVTWPGPATGVLAGFGVVVAALAVLVVGGVLRRRSKRSRVDAPARHMAKGRDLRALSLRGATATAERLGVKGSPGVRKIVAPSLWQLKLPRSPVNTKDSHSRRFHRFVTDHWFIVAHATILLAVALAGK